MTSTPAPAPARTLTRPSRLRHLVVAVAGTAALLAGASAAHAAPAPAAADDGWRFVQKYWSDAYDPMVLCRRGGEEGVQNKQWLRYECRQLSLVHADLYVQP